MKKSRILSVIMVLAMVFALTAATATTASAAAEYEFRLSSSQVTGTWLADLFDEYAEMVNEATDGRINITIFHDNALGSPADLWTMFTQGGLEMLNQGCAQIGEFPITDIVQTPFLLTTPATAQELLEALLAEDMLPEFSDNMHVICFVPTDMQMLATVDDKIESMADFNGLKLRANSGQLIEVIEKLGATAVSITTTEVFLSMSQGVIDGGISSPSAMTAFTWQDVCHYLYDLPISVGMNFIGVNLDTWNSLPEDLQEIMDEVGAEWSAKYIAKNDEMQQACVDQMVEAGVEVVVWDDEMVEEVKASSADLLGELAESLTGMGYDGEAIIAFAQDVVANSEFEQ